MSWHKESVCTIQWSPMDDWSLAVGSLDNTVSLWDFSVEKDDTNNQQADI